MKKETDVSYGVVPIRLQAGTWEVLLIHQISNMRGDSYWIIPKGHPHDGETPVETALRELREETGLVPERLDTDRPFILSYNFRHEDTHIDKTVTFYVGHISHNAELRLQTAEVKAARWCSEEEAYERITHKNARGLLRDVFSYLRNSRST